MKVATGKGTVKPSDLFISTAISFKKCLSLLLLLQSQNKTASCPSEINPKASEAAANDTAYNERCLAIYLPLSSASSRNLASRENDVCFGLLFPFFVHSFSMLLSALAPFCSVIRMHFSPLHQNPHPSSYTCFKISIVSIRGSILNATCFTTCLHWIFFFIFPSYVFSNFHLYFLYRAPLLTGSQLGKTYRRHIHRIRG